MKLSERETAALRALAASSKALSGAAIARAMTSAGVSARTAGAYRTCQGLVNKGVAESLFVSDGDGTNIGYKLTEAGRKAADGLRGES